jgi:hypothetical protein
MHRSDQFLHSRDTGLVDNGVAWWAADTQWEWH